MSYITDVVLFPGTGYPEATRKVMEQVNAFWPDSKAPMLSAMPCESGHKAFTAEVWGSSVNYLDHDGFIRHLRENVEWPAKTPWLLVLHGEESRGPSWVWQDGERWAPHYDDA